MQTIRERARELMPTVILTVLGIIQAIALELLWERSFPARQAWSALGAPVTGWLLLAAVLESIIVIWVLYTSLVVRISWVPQLRDSLIPFALGMLEFVLVEQLVPERLYVWFLMLSLIFLFASSAAYATFVQASRDLQHGVALPESRLERLRGYGSTGVSVVMLVASSLLVVWRGPASWIALAAVALANAMLVGQIFVLRAHWKRDLETPDGSSG